MCGVFGDKCVLRSFSPLQTIAGATLLNPLPHFPKLSKIPEYFLDLEQMFSESQQYSSALYEQLKAGNEKGIGLGELALLCPFDKKHLEKILQDLLVQKRCLLYDKENKIYLADTHVKEYEQAMLQKVREYHQSEPLKQYMPKASLLSFIRV